MASSTPRYDAAKIDFEATYYSVQADEAIRLTFTQDGKVKLDKDGVPVMNTPVTLVKVGAFRAATEDVDRPVFQTQQVHAVIGVDLARWQAGTSALNVTTVLAKRAAAVSTAKVAGF